MPRAVLSGESRRLTYLNLPPDWIHRTLLASVWRPLARPSPPPVRASHVQMNTRIVQVTKNLGAGLSFAPLEMRQSESGMAGPWLRFCERFGFKSRTHVHKEECCAMLHSKSNVRKFESSVSQTCAQDVSSLYCSPVRFMCCSARKRNSTIT